MLSGSKQSTACTIYSYTDSTGHGQFNVKLAVIKKISTPIPLENKKKTYNNEFILRIFLNIKTIQLITLS